MKNNLTYQEAFAALEKLVNQIEDEEIQLDTLAEKVNEANGLILFCGNKLRNIETEVKEMVTNGSAKLK
jgi:exodeoxyribonuclease VII small subunit